MEKLARFPGGEKIVESCHVSGCHGLSVQAAILLENLIAPDVILMKISHNRGPMRMMQKK